MQLIAMTDKDIKQYMVNKTGIEFSHDNDLITELLRSELSARRLSSRRGLCNRIAVLMESFCPVDVDIIKENLLLLENIGDITGGTGGQVAVAPLRAVKLDDNKYQLFGTLNDTQLTSCFLNSNITTGLTRILNLKDSDQENFDQLLDKLGGVILSPERWAGMDKVNAADQEWLAGLDSRLKDQPRPPGSLDNEINDGWRVYQSDKAKLLQKARWQKGSNDKQGYLWRVWHVRGWPVFAWTAGNSPDQQESIKLSSDDACRTMFALDRKYGTPIACQATKENNIIQVKIGGFLPRAEYRYLAIKGKFTEKKEDYFCFQFKTDIWTQVSKMLDDRLGVQG